MPRIVPPVQVDGFPLAQGGFGKGGLMHVVHDRFVKVVVSDIGTGFDETLVNISLLLLRESIFAYGKPGMLAQITGLRTPALGKSYDGDTGGSRTIIYETHRCSGEKLYNLMMRLRNSGLDSFNSVRDETAPKDNKVQLEIVDPAICTIDLLLDRRRKSTSVFTKYVTELFNSASCPSSQVEPAVNGESVANYLLNKRLARTVSAPELGINGKFGSIEPGFYPVELLCDLYSLGVEKPFTGFTKLCHEAEFRKSITELSDVIAADSESLKPDRVVALHDDNNKNSIVGVDMQNNLLLYRFDFDELSMGHAAENWFRQSVYPGQYIDMPSVVNKLDDAGSEKTYKHQAQQIISQIQSYLRIDAPERGQQSAADFENRLLAAYGVMTKCALRDSAFFISVGEMDIANGFWMSAIDFARFIRSARSSMLPTLADRLSNIHERIFYPKTTYRGVEI